MSDQEMSEVAKSAASKLFDIRLLIGGLFTFYGVVLIIYGFVVKPAEIAKAAGLNVNLGLGIGMLILGLLFLVWRKVSPDASHAESNPTESAPVDGGRPTH